MKRIKNSHLRSDVYECRYLGLHLARLVVHSLVHDLEGRDGGEALLSRLAVREVDNWTGVAGLQVSLRTPSKKTCRGSEFFGGLLSLRHPSSELESDWWERTED